MLAAVVNDVYRTAAMICPACASPLRAFQERCCCDGCGGMLIEVSDFESACLDMSMAATVEIYDRKPSTDDKPPVCPICSQAMGTCRVRVGGKKMPGEFSTCERDGLWFGQGVLAAVFARVGRTLIGYTGGQQFHQSTGDATDRLSIAAWRNRPRKRSPTLTPVNAYRDVRLPCPRCTGRELAFLTDRYGCDECHGVFVENAALEALVAEMTGEPWQVPAPTGAPGPRTCPICAATLGVEALEGASIDRCPTHGIWFDPRELESVLQHAVAPPGGLVGWLRRLF